MRRAGLQLAAAVALGLTGGSVGRAQVPVYMPPSQGATFASSTLVDPSPVYRPPSYHVAAQPSVPSGVPAGEIVPPHSPTVPWPTTAPSNAAVSQPPTYTPPVYSPPAPAYGQPHVPSPYPPQAGMHGHPSPHAGTNLPGYASGGTPAYQQPTASHAYGGEMPCGTFDRQSFPPYGTPTGPQKYSQWMPTRYAQFGGACAPGGCGPCGESEYACDPMCCDPCCGPLDNIGVIWEANAFKSPLDLDGLNANYGTRAGVFGAVPVSRDWGLGIQAGATAGYYNYKGSLFTGDGSREQYFATLGVFQRFCSTGFGWGVTYDWLWDDYYDDFFFGQWRVAAGWQMNPCNEIGVWAAMPDRRDEAFVGTPAVRNDFESVLQANLYYRHVWSCMAATTAYVGLAESPSDIAWGSSTEVAINDWLAFRGGLAYILPGSGGTQGRQEEIWNLTFGVTIYPGSAMCVNQSQFRPLLPMADNGNFAIQRD